jgi:putative acetyltransferase
MEIRPYIPEDAAAVREVHRRAFDGSEGEPCLVELLHRAKAASVSLVAVMVSQVVGHILFSPVVLDGRSGLRMVGLAPVGVLPEYQGKGIGSRLARKGLAAFRDVSYGAAVVLGEPSYYSRFGFVRASEYGLGHEYGVGDHFMVAELERGALDRVSGTVRYRPKFREAGALGAWNPIHRLGTTAGKSREQLDSQAESSWRPRASVFPFPYFWRPATRATAVSLAFCAASTATPKELATVAPS